MDRKWGEVFRQILGKTERSLVNEILSVRNRWAHQEPFSSDDAYRALDSVERLLSAVSAPESDEVDKMKMELLRLRFDEQVRGEKRRSAGSAIESGVTGSLKVVMPHEDEASGRYQQAEFAADLWQVHLGEGTAEYRDPVEFFRRTYLTESLKGMLVGALRRLSPSAIGIGGGAGGDPVIQLQTNFGGGKTHSIGQLGAGDREGRGRAEFLAAQTRQRVAQPGEALGLSAGSAYYLSGLGADHGRRAQGDRGPAGEARLRHARRIPRRVW